MAELILKFNDEDFEDARTAMDGWKWKMSMQDLDQHLRNEIKYNAQISSDTANAYDCIREKIREILNDNHLSIE
jgi:hypothetical protein